MAIYHFHMQTISRGQGRTATAAAAYRAGELVADHRTGEVHDYTRKQGVLFTEVLTPDGRGVKREELWNQVEGAERRCDARLAREIVVALPHELTREQQQELVVSYAQELASRTGWAVDVAIHKPGREGDHRNDHAHLLCTTRRVERDDSGNLVVGIKTREWDNIKTGRELITQERQHWERAVNHALERNGFEQRVDCRSHAEKGDNLIPLVHLGPQATGLERAGKTSELGDLNREITQHNAQVIQLSEVRKEREEAQAFEKTLEALKTMPYEEMERTVSSIHPQSVRAILCTHPEVKDAAKLLADAPTDERGRLLGPPAPFHESHLPKFEQAIISGENRVKNDQSAVQKWEKAHPFLAQLHRNPLLPYQNKELAKLEGSLKASSEDLAKAQRAREDYLKARQDALKKLDTVLEKHRPWAEKQYQKRMERFERMRPIREQRREQQREMNRLKEKEQERGR
jgi:hypothetical protein